MSNIHEAAERRTIYVCVASWDYEGSSIDGIYRTLSAARKHKWCGGDSQEVQRWKFDSKGVGQMQTIVDLSIRRKRRPTKRSK